MIIISIITSVTWKERIIMKGVRRQRLTGCTSWSQSESAQYTAEQEDFRDYAGSRGEIIQGNARAGCGKTTMAAVLCARLLERDRQARVCYLVFGKKAQRISHCWKRQLQAKERRSMGHEAQSCTRHCSLTAGLNLLLSSCWLSDRDAVFLYSGAGSMSVFAGLSASRWHHRGIGTDPRCSWRSMSSRNASTILLTAFKQIFGTGEMLPLSPVIPPLPRVQIDALHGYTSWSQRQYRPANPVDLRRLPDPVRDEQSGIPLTVS